MGAIDVLAWTGREEQLVGKAMEACRASSADVREWLKKELGVDRLPPKLSRIAGTAVRRRQLRLQDRYIDAVDLLVRLGLQGGTAAVDRHLDLLRKAQILTKILVGPPFLWCRSGWIGPVPGTRLRVRRVDEVAACQYAMRRAAETGKPYVHCEHGGGVCNAYGYPATTEAVVAVGFPDGVAVYDFARVSANKVTLAGAAGGAWSRTAKLAWDKRACKEVRERVQAAIIREAYAVAKPLSLAKKLFEWKKSQQEKT